MALLVLILVFTLSDVVLGCCVGKWRITPLCMSLPGFIVFFELSPLVLLGRVRSTCYFLVLCLLGFLGTLTFVFGSGLVCLLFVRSLVHFSFFGRLSGVLGELRLLATLVLGLGFRGGRYLDCRGSFKLLSSPHLRGGDKGFLRGILSGGVWNGFLLSFVNGEIVPCRFCGGPDNDGHFFWECHHPSFCSYS